MAVRVEVECALTRLGGLGSREREDVAGRD